MMWLSSILVLLVSSAALRARETSVLARQTDGEKLYTVEVSLTFTNPESESAIEIAVNGVRHLTKTHSTEEGVPIVLHHLPRGSIVTAHVHASQDACAYWVASGNKQRTVGDWEVAFGFFDESDQEAGDATYEAYVEIVGQGQAVTIEVNNAPFTVYTVQPSEVLMYPALHKGALIKAVSATGDTCTYHVGEKGGDCRLDNSWGIRMGSVQVYDEDDHDEDIHEVDDIKNYTVELALAQDEGHVEVIEITLNGQRVAEKRNPTSEGEALIMRHVKIGSVLAAVSHLTGEACGIYVGVGMQTKTCAGWILNFNLQEETDSSFEDKEKYDFSITVAHAGDDEPVGNWNLYMDNGLHLAEWDRPILFPRVFPGWNKGLKVVPNVNTNSVEGCVHVMGGDDVTCQNGGWIFTMSSRLNMNRYSFEDHHWDWADVDEDVDELPEIDIWAKYKFSVTATDTTSSKSKLVCIAREDLESYVASTGGRGKKIEKDKRMFEPRTLVYTSSKNPKEPKTVKSATFAAEIVGGRTQTNGFVCTVYDKEETMCEANSVGLSMTYTPGCTIHIELTEE